MENIMEQVAGSGMGQKLMEKVVEHEVESQGPAGLMNMAESALGGGGGAGGLMGMAGQFLGGGGGEHHEGVSHQSYDNEEGHHERREEHHSSGGDGDDDDNERRESHRVDEHVSREDEDGGRDESYSHAQVEESHSEGHSGLAGMASKVFHHHEEEEKPADPTGEMISQGLDFAREKFLHQTGVEGQDDKIGEALAGYAHKYMGKIKTLYQELH
ncbi:hypothetical protein KEM56_007279 [Ascosphaera pollenicola]|nr:hypothetical protein KEM56_007279 [Ascosphaera pollenicola]